MFGGPSGISGGNGATQAGFPGAVKMTGYDNGAWQPTLWFDDINAVLAHPRMQRVIFNYTIFENMGMTTAGANLESQGGVYKNCIFRESYVNNFFATSFYVENSVFDELTSPRYAYAGIPAISGEVGFSYNNNFTNITRGDVYGFNSKFIELRESWGLDNFPLPFKRGVTSKFNTF